MMTTASRASAATAICGPLRSPRRTTRTLCMCPPAASCALGATTCATVDTPFVAWRASLNLWTSGWGRWFFEKSKTLNGSVV